MGSNSPIPKIRITTIEKLRKESAGIPKDLTIKLRNKVKNVKLKINPVTTPNGLFLPPVRELDKTTGRIGKIHGDKIVTSPPRNANTNNKIIKLC